MNCKTTNSIHAVGAQASSSAMGMMKLPQISRSFVPRLIHTHGSSRVVRVVKGHRPNTFSRSPLRVNAMRGNFGSSNSFSSWPGTGPSIQDRVMAALPYVLPFLNVFHYGRFLFLMYPIMKSFIKPFIPAIALYHSLPFGSLIAFFGVYLGIVNNQNLSRFVRFNAMQAILLDIILVLPRLIETVLSPPKAGYGLQLYAHSQSFIWIFITTWVIFGIASCAAGHWARIPFIAESADQSVR